jgi:hypothetical protein
VGARYAGRALQSDDADRLYHEQVTFRHADPTDPAFKDCKPVMSTGRSSEAWWDRWAELPTVERDRPAAEVIAEDRTNS